MPLNMPKWAGKFGTKYSFWNCYRC